MNIFLVLIIALGLIIFLLRFKIQIGLAMLISGIFIWLVESAEIAKLFQAFLETFSLPRTYDIVIALYLIMCLEIELRKSGALTDMVKFMRRTFSGVKILLATMPAFLGLLPSVGGARFSAPIVDELSKNLKLKSSHKAAINFWFRHIFEFSSPIIPGMIMACSIAEVAFGEFLRHGDSFSFFSRLVCFDSTDKNFKNCFAERISARNFPRTTGNVACIFADSSNFFYRGFFRTECFDFNIFGSLRDVFCLKIF